jgi:cytochrome b subunit of formate dehydrogenase
MVLLTSFIVLAVTGFALKFPESWLARLLGSSEPFRRWSHRIAGIALLAAGAAHVVYLFTSPQGRRLVRDFFPGPKDLKDLIANLCYFVGLRKEPPRFGRFGYAEKMEYWAVVWGTVIMGGTGLMIWLKIDVTRFVPRWAVEVATTVHFYEAILACLAIVVWHFYHVIFDPAVYPMNLAWWDGKVSPEWDSEEHPLRSPDPRAAESASTRLASLKLEFDI